MDSNTSRSGVRRISLAAFALLAAALQSGCSLFGIRSSEEAGYQVLQQQQPFEIRQYETLVVATTEVDGDFDTAGRQSFRRLFNYISGNNRSQQQISMTAPVIAANAPAGGESIAMTAPVSGQPSGQGWRFSFVLPSGFTLQNAPLPLDGRVELEQIPPRRVAALTYSGSWSQADFDANADLLLQWLELQQLQPESLPRVAGYDPPWTLPFLRRNEVLIDIGE